MAAQAELLAGATARRMDSLRAGDSVLVSNPATGQIYVDRVLFNLHLEDRSGFNGYTFRLSLHAGAGCTTGSGPGCALAVTDDTDADTELSVTADHVMLLAPPHPEQISTASLPRLPTRRLPAHAVKLGDTMVVVHSGSSSARPQRKLATVMAIDPWEGGRINPMTHTGHILAAGSANANINASSPFVLATTVCDSPAQVLMTMTTMPSLLKLGSILFPRQLQAWSTLDRIISAIAAVSQISKMALDSFLLEVSPWAHGFLSAAYWTLSLAVFIAIDVVIGGAFLLFNCATELASVATTASCIFP